MYTLMSISDGLGPSIFCRKRERARPMREEEDGKLFITRQSRLSNFEVIFFYTLFPICTLTWRAKNYVSRQGKGIKRRNESTRHNIIIVKSENCSYFVVLAIFSGLFNHIVLFGIIEKQVDFSLHLKNNQL